MPDSNNDKLQIESSVSMKRGRRKMELRGRNMEKLDDVIERLANRDTLEPWYHDHPLKGRWTGYRECHIEPDWLLIYRVINDRLVLYLTETGTHSDLFDK